MLIGQSICVLPNGHGPSDYSVGVTVTKMSQKHPILGLLLEAVGKEPSFQWGEGLVAATPTVTWKEGALK